MGNIDIWLEHLENYYQTYINGLEDKSFEDWVDGLSNWDLLFYLDMGRQLYEEFLRDNHST